MEEYQLTGATEAHLVEELAGILWRKQRVLMAEGAAINPDSLTDPTREQDEERVAIMAVDGGLSRIPAKRLAVESLRLALPVKN